MYKQCKVLPLLIDQILQQHIVALSKGKKPLNKAEVKIATVQAWKSSFSQSLTAKTLQPNVEFNYFKL